jgi:enoyl-CoA hydratase/carnithine racemase
MALAAELADGPTLIYGHTKSAIVHGWEASPETAYEYQGQALAFARQTEDYNGSSRFKSQLDTI